jgi:hypothetical protein
MRYPSRTQGIVLGSISLGALILALVSSFYGPASAVTYGPPPPGQQLEVQLLTLMAAGSAALLVLAVWRGARFMPGVPLVAGVASLIAGGYLAFGYYLPAGHGSYFAPFTLQGALLLVWGIFALLLGLMAISFARRALPFALPTQPSPRPLERPPLGE